MSENSAEDLRAPSFRTTWAGRLAAVSVVMAAAGAILGGDWHSIDLPNLLQALGALGLGGALAWLGREAKDDKAD